MGVANAETLQEPVNHSKEQLIVDNIHIDGIAGVSSLFSRRIFRPFHKISVTHRERYLEESGWRHNNRGTPMYRDSVTRRSLTGNWWTAPETRPSRPLDRARYRH